MTETAAASRPEGALIGDVKRPTISIVLPLYDRRNAGWESLRSALGQRFPRQRFEIVAVLGQDAATGAARESDVEAMLIRCDAVVRCGVDDTVPANEIQLFLAGYARSRGELIFFCEGHTVLHDDCCALIDEHFARHPQCDIGWAPRLDHADSPLGRLVAMHNRRHEGRAADAGTFTLGASSVIRRPVLEALGGLDPRYLRFSETALYHRALRRHVVVGRIRGPLATHYDDMPADHWRRLAIDTGAARYAYYGDLLARGQGGKSAVRHRAYLYARRAWLAGLLAPPLRLIGNASLWLATQALRSSAALAYRCYLLALGCTDLAGYCRAASLSRRW